MLTVPMLLFFSEITQLRQVLLVFSQLMRNYFQVADVCKKLAAALHLGDKLVSEKDKSEKKKKAPKAKRKGMTWICALLW